MVRGRKCSLGFVSAFLSYLALLSVHKHFDRGGNVSERAEEMQWIASSPSFLDRQACKWLGVCGAFHLRPSGWTDTSQRKSHQEEHVREPELDSSLYWLSGSEDSTEWSHHERASREIPPYVYEYAPMVHLFSSEEYWPCDIADHLVHTTPYLNYTAIEDLQENRTLDNLEELNSYGRFTYLQSDDNVEEMPMWLGGSKNIPRSPGDRDQLFDHEDASWPSLDLNPPNAKDEDWYEAGIGDILAQGGVRPNPNVSIHEAPIRRRDESKSRHERRKGKPGQTSQAGGHSSAPAVLIVVNKGHGVVDAFWFYFYSYNLGNQVLNVRFGNHVGDWEHSVVRFQHGVPKAVFLSEHSFGEAYAYEAMEKIGKRPVIYSGVGTHAMYATPGVHPYVLPWGLLHDETDRGPLWDPALNNHGFVYNYTSGVLRSSTQTSRAPVSWFNYSGRWGDKFYPLSDPRQYRFAGQYHYVTGPLGPRFKNLGRKTICQGNKECVIKRSLLPWGSGVKLRPGLNEDSEG